MKRSYSSSGCCNSTGKSEAIEGAYEEGEVEVVSVLFDQQSDESATASSSSAWPPTNKKAKKRPPLPSSSSTAILLLSSSSKVMATTTTSTKENKGGGKASNDGEDLSSSSSQSSQQQKHLQEQLLLLPKGYIPEPHTIICARGKKYWDHVGNVRYRNVIAAATKRYEQTTNKYDRTVIVSEIVQTLQQRPLSSASTQHPSCSQGSGGGGGGGSGGGAAAAAAATAAHISNFIKLDPTNKQRWMYETDEIFIREKVSQSLRDCLSSKYKSSTKSKKLRKSRMMTTMMMTTTMQEFSSSSSPSEVVVDTMESVIYSNAQISQRIHQLSNDIQICLSNDNTTTTTTTTHDTTTTDNNNNHHQRQRNHTYNTHGNYGSSYSYTYHSNRNRYDYGNNFDAYQQPYYNNTVGGGATRTIATTTATTPPTTTQTVVVRGSVMDSMPSSSSSSSSSSPLLPPSRSNKTNYKTNNDKERELLSLFNQANCDILETIKQDVTLRSKFQDIALSSASSSPPKDALPSSLSPTSYNSTIKNSILGGGGGGGGGVDCSFNTTKKTN